MQGTYKWYTSTHITCIHMLNWKSHQLLWCQYHYAPYVFNWSFVIKYLHQTRPPNSRQLNDQWASYQIRKIAGCACARNAGNVFPCRQFQRKPLVSDPGMHHSTCVPHVPWCMSGSLTCGDGGKRSRRMRTRNFAYLARGPWHQPPQKCSSPGAVVVVKSSVYCLPTLDATYPVKPMSQDSLQTWSHVLKTYVGVFKILVNVFKAYGMSLRHLYNILKTLQDITDVLMTFQVWMRWNVPRHLLINTAMSGFEMSWNVL